MFFSNACSWNIVPNASATDAIRIDHVAFAISLTQNFERDMNRNGDHDSMKATLLTLATLSATLSLGQVAHASSDNAWAEFSAAVEKACIKSASGQIEKGRAVVDPYGSQKYGLAIITGRPSGVPKNKKLADISVICVYDKKTKAAEVGSEIEIGKVGATAPKR